MDARELEKLVSELESDRVERKESITDKEKICQAICAFANDLPDHKKPGYVFVGAKDDGRPSHLTVSDQMLQTLAAIRSDGNILPFPHMNVQKHVLLGAEMAVVEVVPSDSPPVRYKGQTWVRVGPRRAVATQEEERRLTEKRVSGNLTFDRRPLIGATLEDLDLELFRSEYLPNAVAPEVLEENTRELPEQLASLRFVATADGPPTPAGVLAVGKDPEFRIPGAYVQFVRIDGIELTDPIKDEKEIRGALSQQCRRLDEILEVNVATAVVIPDNGPEIRTPDYPLRALQQLIRNALMHRDYESSNAPVRVYWYRDRIEITNPGGLYGQVNPENFRTVTDYRNPQVAEIMKTLGFVQRFGVGIQIAYKALEQNGNPPPEFQFERSFFNVTVRGCA